MPITIRHDAAGVVPPSNSSTRKYGQQLVVQQQQQKYAAQQAGFDRLFQLGRDQMQNQADFVKDVRQSVIQDRRDQAQNDFQTARDKTLFDQQQQQQEMARQQKFMDDARKQSSGIIMQDIQNGEYDPATARKLQQNLIAESEALGNPQYDATQRAEALEKIRAERTLLTTNRLQKPPPPTRDEELKKFLGDEVYAKYGHLPWISDGKGGFSVSKEIMAQQQAKPPTTSAEAFAADPKLRDQYMADARAIEVGDNPLTPENRQKAAALAHKLWEQDNTPTAVPELPGSAPAQPGESRSILEDTASMPDRGMPPSPAVPPKSQLPAAPTPAPTQPGAGSSLPLTSNTSSASVAGATTSPQGMNQEQQSIPNTQPPSQVKVGGQPLVVSPGTLTPQETQARAQIMSLPQEERIKALMPYDPTGELKGRTLEQILEDPESKAQYDELTKQGLTTGNYREDMLNHLDEMLQHNVLKGGGTTPPDAYVGMRADDITDPKTKAEVAKLPRPKSADDRNTIRSGQLYVDPDGIIRARA